MAVCANLCPSSKAPPAVRSLTVFLLLARSHCAFAPGLPSEPRSTALVADGGLTVVLTPSGETVTRSRREREHPVRSRSGGSLTAMHVLSDGEVGDAEGDTVLPDASRLEAGDGQRFWVPPSHGDHFGHLMEWRRRNSQSIHPERLLTMPRASFLQLLRREHQAADFFGNNDGCVTSDEHPDFSVFVGDFGPSVDRICTLHLLRYARTQAFQRDVDSVRRAHRNLMNVIKTARKEALVKVDEELKKASEVIPLSKDLTPGATDKDIEKSETNIGDWKAEIAAEKTNLKNTNDTQYALDAGLIPFTFTPKSSLDAMDVAKLNGSEKLGPPMNLARLHELVERERPERARAVSQKAAMLMRRRHTSSSTFTVVEGPCTTSSNGGCVHSPGYPAPYSDDQRCYIEANTDVALNVESFDTESYYDWLYVDGTYYSGKGGPQGRTAKANVRMIWYSDYSVTRPGWKICASTAPGSVPCIYGRHDVCELQLGHVPLLGTHNSGSYPTLYLECGRKKQVCVQWATKARETCNEHVRECTNWGEEVKEECNSWGTECTSWSNTYCGWFSWLCGSFCSASRTVCTGFSYTTIAVCHKYGFVCKTFTYFVEYVGCNIYKWACEAASDLGIVACVWENQGYNMRGQLSRGVRFFDLDSCLVDMNLFHCHGTDYEKRAIGTEIDADIRMLRDWLVANPSEVVVIGWSDWEHGKSGVDYPSSRTGHDYHLEMRTAVIEKYFTLETGGRCTSVCYASNNDTMKVKDMISKNIRLVVGRRGAGLYLKDSYSEAAVKTDANQLMSHMESYCDGTAAAGAGKLAAGESTALSAFTSILSTAAYKFEFSGKYDLQCPNHCTHPNGQAATCECKAGQGQIQTLVAPGLLVEGGGNTSDESEAACNSWNSAAVNRKLPDRLSGIVDRCYRRGSPISVIMVDYVSESNSEIQNAVQLAINEAVVKFR